MLKDVIIIGGGPAGLTAALYIRRAGKSALVIEKNTFGGQITWSPKVDNFPALPGVSGMELADRLVAQVMEYDVELELDEVLSVKKEHNTFTVNTAFGQTFEGRAVILASGARPRLLGLDEEEGYVGKGVSFCAVCDGEFYRDRTVAVIGGGNTALQEALYLSDLCEKVYLIHRRDEFRADSALVDRIGEKDNVELLLSRTVGAFHGDDHLTSVTLHDVKGGGDEDLPLDGLFTAIGHEPQNEVMKDFLGLDDEGYALAGEDCMTFSDGVFVAGDCRTKEVRQLTTAVADGTTAALAACRYIDSLK